MVGGWFRLFPTGRPFIVMTGDSGQCPVLMLHGYGANAAFVEDLYARWSTDPGSVDASWAGFFATLHDRAEEVQKAASKVALLRAPSPQSKTTSQ